MSTLSGGPNIVVDGLTWYLDAANTKSYVSGSTSWNTMIRGDRNGVLVNGATFDTATNSIEFDGTDDYVSSSFNPNYASGSICMWVYPTTGSSNCFCLYTAANPLTSYQLVLGRTIFGKLRGYIYDLYGKFIDSLGDFNLDVWNHIVLTWKNNDSVKTYLNGRLENTTTLGSMVTLSPGGFYLGSTNGGTITGFKAPFGYLKGKIGASQVYNRDLSADEVLQNYNAHRRKYNAASPNPIVTINPGPYTGSIEIVTSSLTTYYDASIYNSYPYSGSIWYDISGNNRHAAIYNSIYTGSNSGSLIFTRGYTYADLGFNFAGLGFTNEFSYGGWMKPTVVGEATLMADWAGNGTTLRINSNFTSADFYIYPGNYRITYSYPFATGSWYNLVAVASGSSMLLYLNGNFAASRSLPGNIGTPNLNVTAKMGLVGGYGGSTGAEIASAYIYSKPLSPSEVLQNYSSSKDRFGL